MKTIIISATFLALCVITAFAQKNLRVTLELVTPEGAPVVKAKAGFGGGMSTPTNGPFPAQVIGLTDTNGQFSGVIVSRYGSIDAFAEKDGYYRTEAHSIRLLPSAADARAMFQQGRWEPWEHTIKLVHKPIRSPIPMYVRGINGDIPETNCWVGLDLERGDWVAPYGKGVRPDFEFFATGVIEDYRHNYRGSLVLRLPGERNGIQTYDYSTNDVYSAFKMPYLAPTEGYLPTWAWTNALITPAGPYSHSHYVDESYPRRGFVFRVRSVVDSDGKLVRAEYGKIEGPFVFGPRGQHGKCHVSFVYFLNPSGTPNLEFDSKRNLFTTP